MDDKAQGTAVAPATGLDSLKDLTVAIQRSAGFHPLVAALRNGGGVTVDGAWNSSAALVTAALSLHAPRTLVVVLAHPRDNDFWAEDLHSFAGVRSVLFPAWDAWPVRESVVDEIGGQRLRVLNQLDHEPPRLLLTTLQALLQPVPDRGQLAAQRRALRVGQTLALDEFCAWLVQHGFQRMEAVELPGEFSLRGGILDVFSHDAEAPCRVEFFGDDIESIRQFSPQTQRSLGELPATVITAAHETTEPHNGTPTDPDRGHLADYLPADAWVVLVEPDDLREQGKHFLERAGDLNGLFALPATFSHLQRFAHVRLIALPSPGADAACHLRVESVERFSGDVAKVRDELDGIASGDRVLIACHNEAEQHRLGEVLKAGALAQSDRLRLVVGRLHAGFRLVDARVLVLSDHELFHREQARSILPRRQLESRAIDSFLDLQEGDLVVHVSQGIARFRGMHMLEKNGQTEEHLILEFREGTRVYVPASKIDLVQKYVGGSNAEPELSKLGGTGWQRKKEKVQEAVFDLASEMVELQALREAQPGIAYPPDTEWQAEFEAAFPYEETPDQLTSLVEIKRDMQRPQPMDRLICGDVGYGKTELAIRAAFKAIDNGRQVAVLVPTTVLAEQHYRTFSERLAEYPFVVEGISRFRSGAEQRRILDRLASGAVDIIIGTHRLVSADVQLQGPRPGRHRRGAALRRRAQGTAQTTAADGGRADHDRDAHPAHAAPVAAGHPRHQQPGNAAARPPGHRDAHRPLRPAADPPRHPPRTQPRRPGLFRPQPRPRHGGDAPTNCSVLSQKRALSSATARWRSTNWSRRWSASSAATPTSCSAPPSSRAAWTFPTRTPFSSTRRTTTAWRTCTSCAAASVATSTAPTPTCCSTVTGW